MSDEFPFVRITVLGAAGSGKTCLIHSFVNNNCPLQHIPTVFPALYYRVVRLPPEADPRGPVTSVCVEIEDTVTPEVVEVDEVQATDTGSPESAATNSEHISHLQRKATKLKNVEFFFDMTRRNIVVPEGVTDFTPFSIWKAPKVPISMDRPVYVPLTQGRMAFIIVFDSTDSESFERACQIHTALVSDMDAKKVRIRPYICFVANKIEKDPESEEHKGTIELAERYTQQRFVRLMKVSSISAKNVKRVFWDLLYLTIGNQVLWEIEYENPTYNLYDEEDSRQESGCIQS